MRPRWLSTKGPLEDSTSVKLPAILLIEPNDELRNSRLLLLSCVDSAAEVGTTQSAIYEFPESTPIRLVVIAIGGHADTEHVAFLARHRWPKAKILLIGSTCGDLPDSLYDDIIDPCCNPVGFVEVSRRLLKQSSENTACENRISKPDGLDDDRP